MVQPISENKESAGDSSVAVLKDTPIVSETLTFTQWGDNYLFYDAKTATGKPNAYRKFLAQVKKTIQIWDPYFVSVRILGHSKF